MKKCLNCDIEVGGEIEVCPLCQHGLTGEASANNWPYLFKLKKQAFLYKIQLFAALVGMVVALGLDFLFGLNNGKHWSYLIVVGLIVVEMLLKRFLKKKVVVTKIVSLSAFWAAVILVLTASYFGIMHLVVFLIIPIMMSSTIVANSVLTFIDKSGNALVYVLVNILFAIVSYGFLFFKKYELSLTWNICLMISAVALLGMLVFRGKKVTGEVEKRMNI